MLLTSNVLHICLFNTLQWVWVVSEYMLVMIRMIVAGVVIQRTEFNTVTTLH